MKLSVVIPTYNREKLLAQTLQSLDNAKIPPNLEVEVIVVNNNSTDNTEQVIEKFKEQAKHLFRLTSIFEVTQGRSTAVNAGIRQSDGDLITMIDDDIQVESDWFSEVEKIFSTRWDEFDFIGGKILPNWEVEPPEWVKEIKEVGICWRDYGDKEWWYSRETPMLTGGHAVFKSKVFDDIGLYSEELGPKGKNLIGCEDDVIFDKLMKAEKKGLYHPQLVVYHYVPAYRLEKSYYRQWNFGAGMSWNLMEIHYQRYEGVKIFQIPRYLYSEALVSLKDTAKYLLKGNKNESLKAEKGFLIFAGYLYGRNLQNSWLDKPLKSVAGKLVKSKGR